MTKEEVVAREERRINADLLERPDNGDRWGAIRQAMGESMVRNVAVFRDEQTISEAIRDFSDLRERYSHGARGEQAPDLQYRPGFRPGTGVHAGRGRHHRLQRPGASGKAAAPTPAPTFPKRDDENWLKHIVAKKGEVGPELSYLPVSITRWHARREEVLTHGSYHQD